MTIDTDCRLTIRATPEDMAHLATIGAALRAQGVNFATRTAAVRHALATVAAAVAVPVGSVQR